MQVHLLPTPAGQEVIQLAAYVRIPKKHSAASSQPCLIRLQRDDIFFSIGKEKRWIIFPWKGRELDLLNKRRNRSWIIVVRKRPGVVRLSSRLICLFLSRRGRRAVDRFRQRLRLSTVTNVKRGLDLYALPRSFFTCNFIMDLTCTLYLGVFLLVILLWTLSVCFSQDFID